MPKTAKRSTAGHQIRGQFAKPMIFAKRVTGTGGVCSAARKAAEGKELFGEGLSKG